MVIEVAISLLPDKSILYKGIVIANIEHAYKPDNIYIDSLNNETDVPRLKVHQIMILTFEYEFFGKIYEFNVYGYLVWPPLLGKIVFLLEDFHCFSDGKLINDMWVENLNSIEGFETYMAVEGKD